ncbi:MAG: ribosome-associated translation inhibitor RaiA [Myxococcales bacterium]|nr:ribosome-associated translation inhibitor RaiA [Myxococcales bacterium]MCB9630452.1 ribosome-associated translation inhibitor RaiA [Sandaracinaceae bacterium]
MRINFTFRHLEPSDGIKSYATEKVARLQKFLRAPLTAEVTVATERHLHQVDISVVCEGQRYAATEESEDMYASIDMVLDKIDRQVRSRKDAETAKMRHAHESVHLGKHGA